MYIYFVDIEFLMLHDKMQRPVVLKFFIYCGSKNKVTDHTDWPDVQHDITLLFAYYINMFSCKYSVCVIKQLVGLFRCTVIFASNAYR